MKAIVLVGGFGTRLKTLVPDLPKPMAPIQGKPFLAYLLQFLRGQGITDIIFPVHYLGHKISEYFGDHYLGMTIQYIDEKEPLGTGGAIVNALTLVQNDEPVFVLNGDTFVKLDYQHMFRQHECMRSQFTMALRSVADCMRYGSVIVEDNVIVKFAEKGRAGPGFINAGVYVLRRDVFQPFKLPAVFSIETDFLYPFITQIQPHAFCTDDYFIDIGIPDDYGRACAELPALC